jgi:methylmalonyl-CoA mutase N-terminal domain/subunit
LEEGQRRELLARKNRRAQPAVHGALERIREAARGSANLMPPIIEAVKAGGTLGEISDALRMEWGTYDG